MFRHADVVSFVSWVHPVVEDAIGDHTVEAYSRAGLTTVIILGSHECLLLFTPSCCSECFYDL